MKTLILTALLAGSAAAQITATVGPFGAWPLCEDQATAGRYPGICAGFEPGNEQYLLSISTTDSQTTAYTYSASAVLVSTGAVVRISGIVNRNDKNGVTMTLIGFGGVVRDIDLTVQALVVGGVFRGGPRRGEFK
jgi:hypothetical protein